MYNMSKSCMHRSDLPRRRCLGSPSSGGLRGKLSFQGFAGIAPFSSPCPPPGYIVPSGQWLLREDLGLAGESPTCVHGAVSSTPLANISDPMFEVVHMSCPYLMAWEYSMDAYIGTRGIPSLASRAGVFSLLFAV